MSDTSGESLVPTRRRVLGGVAALAAGTGGVLGRGAAQPDADLSVEPADALLDEQPAVRVSGVDPGARVTVTARTADDGGRQWASFARFEADGSGAVDLATAAPDAGTYDRADPSGLLWSMRRVGDGGIVVPTPPDSGVLPVEFAVEVDGREAASATLRRRFWRPEVSRTDLDGGGEDGLVGAFYAPPGEGPHPGVVALHGSDGRIPHVLSSMLASRGFATLGLQYFGGPGLPDELVGVPLEYVGDAIEWVRSRPSVADGDVGLIGGSKGGELALLAGATFDGVGAVVGQSASGVVFQGISNSGAVGSSWTLDGEDVPYAPVAFPPSLVADVAWNWLRGDPISLRATYAEGLAGADADRVAEATIPVERIDGPVLLVAGGDDALWPGPELSRVAADRLRERDRPVTLRTYDDAGHVFPTPVQPTAYFPAAGNFLPGAPLALGGDPPAIAAAAADAWSRTLDVLGEGLA